MEEIRDAVGRVHDLLEVVEDEQHVPGPQLELQRLEQLLVVRAGQTDSANDCLEDRVRVAHAREVDEVHAVVKTVDLVGRCLEG